MKDKKAPVDPALLSFARRTRSEPTNAESKLWFFLRRRQLCGFRFRRQVPIAGFIVDFHCPEAGLAIELDGGQHAEVEARASDAAREKTLAAGGIRVLRFWDDEVFRETQAVLERIAASLPQPPPGGRGLPRRGGPS